MTYAVFIFVCLIVVRILMCKTSHVDCSFNIYLLFSLLELVVIRVDYLRYVRIFFEYPF